MLVLAAPIAAAGLLALERVPGAAAGLFFAFFDAGVGTVDRWPAV